MTAYGSNTVVQTIVYGTTDSNEDTRCTNARTTATYLINTELGLDADLLSADNEINTCCNYLAAGIISSSPETVTENIFWKIGKTALSQLKNRSSTKPSQDDSILVDRF